MLPQGDSLVSRNGHSEIWRALAQPVTYLGVAMLVTIYCALAYLLIADRKIADNDAARDAGNLVRIFGQSLSNIFNSADAALLFLRKSYMANPATFDLADAANDPAFKNDVRFRFTIANASGHVVASTYSKRVIGNYLGDRAAFRAHVNSSSDEFFIGTPLVLRSTGERAIVTSRRIMAADGAFIGVIFVLLDPNQLGNYLRAPDLGPEGSVALIGLDGVIRVRAVDGRLSEDMIGRKLGPNVSLVPRASRASAGIYWNTPGNFDNVKRLVAYRVLEAFPLIAIVTFSDAHVFRNANKNARIYWGIVVLLSAGILIAIFFGAARERKLIATTSEMKEAEEALRRSEERNALVAEATNDGVWDWNRITGEVYLSPRWKNILGYADDELPNTDATFLDRLHPDDQPIVQQMRISPLEGDRPFSIEVRLRHKDGSYRWVLSRGKTIFDAPGRPARRLGTITDVTERMQIARAGGHARRGASLHSRGGRPDSHLEYRRR
jgi:PAS domain S-box-containing protein